MARAAVFLTLLLRGTPFLYAGEELGLLDADVPPEQRQDPGGWRDGCRAPIPWDSTPTHGWVRADNWLPFPPEPEARNAEILRSDPSSITNLYRDILTLRRAEPALRVGEQVPRRDMPETVVSWERVRDGTRFLVVVNMGQSETEIADPDSWELTVGSDPALNEWESRLPANTAVLLRHT